MQHLKGKGVLITGGGSGMGREAALPAMVERGEGEFVSFASIAGIIPPMLTGTYSTSKGASIGPLARRLAPGYIWKHNHKIQGFSSYSSRCPE